jgi:sugar lactone lactonase YvrE
MVRALFAGTSVEVHKMRRHSFTSAFSAVAFSVLIGLSVPGCADDSDSGGASISAVDASNGGGGLLADGMAGQDVPSSSGLDGISIPDGGFVWPEFDAETGKTDVTAPDSVEDVPAPPDDVAQDVNDDGGTGPEPDVVEDTSVPDVVDEDSTVAPPMEFECETVADLPVPYETMTGYTTSEDFTFDDQGNLIASHNNNLIKMAKGGDKQVITPNIGNTAGMAFLPNGDVAVASVENGSLLRIAPNGAKVTVLSGLEYPNGLDIDEDGRVYVAEQDGQRLRRVDPFTGEFVIIGEDLCNANGVSFAPGYQRIYVGSFGCGVVYAIDRIDKDTWAEPFLFASIGEEFMDGGVEPEEPAGPPAFCDGQSEGDMCHEKATGPGTCQDEGDGMFCEANDGPSPLVLICEGKSKDGDCQIEVAGSLFTGFCQTNNYTGGGSDVLECNIDDNPICEGLDAGDPCVKLTYGYPYFGTCSNGLRCNGEPPSGGGGGGGGGDTNGSAWGLDGLNVDACGYVYVTEYVDGVVWRINPDGTGLGKAAVLPSGWIPNMHWGTGIGGWDPTILYVSDRDEGRLFALEIGKPGKEVTAP